MIIDELIKIKKERKLTNKQFAETLDIHLQSWYRNKRLKVISASVLLKAFEVYPELRDRWLSSFQPKKHSGQREAPLKSFYVAFIKGVKNLCSLERTGK